jgi:Spy/CpxP family protein refolding chaperone
VRDWRRHALTALVAFCAAIAATWLVREFAPPRDKGGELERLVHEKLDLDPTQAAKIDALDAQFAAQRKLLDERLRAANGQLAQAIANEHQYGPRVALAVDRSHEAMGDLQKAPLSNVFAMRAVLTPEQAERFDAEIGKALTSPDQR